MGNDWYRVEFSHYFFNAQKMTKKEANQYCKSHNSGLLEINSDKEEEFIEYKIKDLIAQEFLPSDFNKPILGIETRI